jgi:YbgC/YbaW family acyl-CoA thioester hydrolase
MSFPRSDFRFFERLRVRWAEVDMQSIVFNGHYLMYFDTAVAGYWRALAIPYHETMEYLGGDFYVRKSTLEYEASARYTRSAPATRR